MLSPSRRSSSCEGRRSSSRRTMAWLARFFSIWVIMVRKSRSLSSNFSRSKLRSALRVALMTQSSSTVYFLKRVGVQWHKIVSSRRKRPRLPGSGKIGGREAGQGTKPSAALPLLLRSRAVIYSALLSRRGLG